MKLGRIPLLILCCTLLMGMAAASPIQCNLTVFDSVGILGNRMNDVNNAANTLKVQGADVHIITMPRLLPGQKLSTVATDITRTCPTWLNGKGSDVNENFIGMFLATDGKHDAKGTTGRVGLLLGNTWTKKIGSQVGNIQDNYIMPSFRSLDFPGAVIVGIKQINIELKVVNEASLHPPAKTTTIIHQATDLSGFWKFLMWLLIACAGGLGIILVVKMLRRRKEDQEAITTAQQGAVSARNRASNLMSELEQRFSDLDNSATAYSPLAKAYYTEGSKTYSRLASTESNNPSTNGLTSSQYVTMANNYDSVSTTLNKAARLLDTPTMPVASPTASVPPVSPAPISVTATVSEAPATTPHSAPSVPSTPSSTSSSQHQSRRHHYHEVEEPETVVIHDSPIYNPSPVIVLHETEPDSYRSTPSWPSSSYEPTYRQPEPEPTRSSFVVRDDEEEKPAPSSFYSAPEKEAESSSFFSSSSSNNNDDDDSSSVSVSNDDQDS